MHCNSRKFTSRGVNMHKKRKSSKAARILFHNNFLIAPLRRGGRECRRPNPVRERTGMPEPPQANRYPHHLPYTAINKGLQGIHPPFSPRCPQHPLPDHSLISIAGTPIITRMLSLPAIHRGQHPSPQTPLKEVNAHDRTNLLHRGHTPPPQSHIAKGSAHDELQELTF